MIIFEWDTKKDRLNQKKHGVSFNEAKSVFFDENAVQFFDEPYSSTREERFLMLGLSSSLRILLVCHCIREDEKTIRIISARKATKKERKFYPGGQQ
ncbi:BrnT family toxin [Candidatus Riflebacteria bacterium]